MEQNYQRINGRDKRGRFAVDNPGGPRRSRREAERAYVDATFATVPIAAWIEIVARAVNDAKDGDQAALAWLSKSRASTRRERRHTPMPMK